MTASTLPVVFGGGTPVPPTPGNLVLYVAFADKNKVLTLPSGFTSLVNVTNTSLSYMAGYRIAQTGDSAIIQGTQAMVGGGSISQGASRVWAMEIAGNYAIGQAQSAYSGESPSSPSQGTGTTSALSSGAGLGIAFFGADSVNSVRDGNSYTWSDGWTPQAEYVTDPVTNSGLPALIWATKSGGLITTGESANFSYTLGATTTIDQMAGIILTVYDTNPPVSGRSVSVTLRDGSNALLNNVTRNFWTRPSIDAAAVDGGAGGLAITCNASGVFNLTGLTIPAGAGQLTYINPADPNTCHTVPVVYA